MDKHKIVCTVSVLLSATAAYFFIYEPLKATGTSYVTARECPPLSVSLTVCVCVCVRACAHVRKSVRSRVCMCMSVRASLNVRERKGEEERNDLLYVESQLIRYRCFHPHQNQCLSHHHLLRVYNIY